jgi:hypothetical protein
MTCILAGAEGSLTLPPPAGRFVVAPVGFLTFRLKTRLPPAFVDPNDPLLDVMVVCDDDPPLTLEVLGVTDPPETLVVLWIVRKADDEEIALFATELPEDDGWT